MGEDSDEDEYSSDDDDEGFGCPMSVHDVRREAARQCIRCIHCIHCI